MDISDNQLDSLSDNILHNNFNQIVKKDNISNECPICYEIINNGSVTTPCNHTFCYNCYMQFYDKTNKRDCPLCRKNIQSKKIDFNDNILIELDFQKSYANNGMGYHTLKRSYFLWINVYIKNIYSYEDPILTYTIDQQDNTPCILISYNKYKKAAFTLPAYISDIEFNPLKMINKNDIPEIIGYKSFSYFISGCNLVNYRLLEAIVRLQSMNITDYSMRRPDYRDPSQLYDRVKIKLKR